jgi:hypothetical protein
MPGSTGGARNARYEVSEAQGARQVRTTSLAPEHSDIQTCCTLEAWAVALAVALFLAHSLPRYHFPT